jgi:hypothetical protein
MVCRRLRSILLIPQYLNDSDFDTRYMHRMNVILKVHIADILGGQEWSMTCKWNDQSQRMATV